MTVARARSTSRAPGSQRCRLVRPCLGVACCACLELACWWEVPLRGDQGCVSLDVILTGSGSLGAGDWLCPECEQPQPRQGRLQHWDVRSDDSDAPNFDLL